MDEFCQIWHGQLMVGTKDMGPAVIWSLHNTHIPALCGNLKMTRIAEYDHLWRFIQGKTVSMFTITSDTPQFLQLTQELTQTRKPPILKGEVINPGEHVEVILAPHCPELQHLGLKDLQDAFQPSLVIIFESKTSVKSAVNVDREHSICEFSQVYGDFTSCRMSEKNIMVEGIETKDRSEQKHQGNKKPDKVKGRKTQEKKNSTIHTRTSKPRKCKTLVNMNLVKLSEKKEEEKAMKMHGKQYLENDKEVKKNGMNAKGCTEPEKYSEKTAMPSHIHRGKAVENYLNNIVCADKATGNALAEICIGKKSSLESKDEETVLTTSTLCKVSSEKQQSSVSGKTSMLDTKKFNEFFFSKDTVKPDLIKPSMLKKSLKRNKLEGNVKKFSSQEVDDYDCVIPDLLIHSETLSKKSNRNDEKRPLKESKDYSSHPSPPRKDEEKSKKNEKLEGKDSDKREDKNVENNNSPSEMKSDSTYVITSEKEILKEIETTLDNLQFPSCRASELLETDVNQQTDKLRDSKSLSQFKKKSNTNHEVRKEKWDDICIKTNKNTTNKIKLLLEDIGFKRKPDETDKVESMCSPMKKARVILKDIMKGSNKVKISRLQDILKHDDLNDKTYVSRQDIKPFYRIDTPQPSYDLRMSKHFMDFKSRNVYGTGSFQERCKRKDSEPSTDKFPQFTCEDKIIDGVCFINHIKEPSSVKQEFNSEYKSDINTVEKKSKTRANEHAFHTNNSIPATIELQTEMNELQNVQDYPPELSMEHKSDMNTDEKKSETRVNEHAFHINNSVPTAIELQTEMNEFQDVQDCPLDLSIHSEHPSQPCDLECPESDLMIITQGTEVTKPIPYIDTPYRSSYPRMLKKYKAFDFKDCERNVSLHENFEKKDIEQSSDELECTVVNESMDGVCFIDHIKEPDSFGQELLCGYKLDTNEKKSEKSVKQHVRDSVLDDIELNAELNKLFELQDQPLDFSLCSENSPQLFCQEQPESHGIVRTPKHGVDAGTKGMDGKMLLHNIPSSTSERQLVDKFHNTVAVDVTKTTASTETVSLDCKTALHSLDVKKRERLCSSNQTLIRPSLLSLSSLNSCAVEKTMSLFSETARHNQIQRSPLLEKSSMLTHDRNSCLFSEVSKTFKSLKKNYELISGLRENKIYEEGRLMQNNENHPIENFDPPCYGAKDPPNIHMPTGVAKKISREDIRLYDFHRELDKSFISLPHTPGFDISPSKQKESDVELLFEKMNNRFRAYSLALTSHETQTSSHGGFKTLANFILTSTNTTPNIICPALVTDNSTTGDQQGKNFISSQQLKIFIIQQLIKLHAPYQIENVIMTPHNSNEADALFRCRNPQKYQHSPQQCRPLDCQNGPESTRDILKYLIESKVLSEGMRGNCVPSFKGLTASQITAFVPNDLYQPSWKGSHSLKSYEGLQMQRYIHLFNADQQDIVKLKCLLVVHDMSYATLEEIKRFGGNIYIRPSALDQLLAHPVLPNICLLPHVQFGVYNSLLTVLNGGAWPILKSKWLLLVDHTAMVDKSFVKILQEVLRDEDIRSHHHHCVFIPILTLKTCIHMLENSSRKLTMEQELCCILQRNITMLIECMMMGVAHIIGGESYWGSLSPESPTTDFLMCLKVIHRCLQFVHRHTAVLVGDSFLDSNRILQNSFYSVCTVTNMIKANFDS